MQETKHLIRIQLISIFTVFPISGILSLFIPIFGWIAVVAFVIFYILGDEVRSRKIENKIEILSRRVEEFRK